MKLTSITLTSSTRASIITDALRSVVDWVDEVLLVHLFDDSGKPEDDTLARAQAVAGKKLRVVKLFLLPSLTVGAMRNFGLDCAMEGGADWACQLDTDERLHLNGVDIRATLVHMDASISVANVVEVTGVYTKPRFFRLPTTDRFQLNTHEEFHPTGKSVLLPRVRFSELPKGASSETVNLATLQGLQQQLQGDPENPRWWYYQGLTLEQLGRCEEAVAAYQHSLELKLEPYTRSWTHFRLAICLQMLRRHQQALSQCLVGWGLQPLAELAWCAGLQCYYLGRFQDAILWEHQAASLGWQNATCREDGRLGPKYPEALFEAPYEVLAQCYQELGDHHMELVSVEQMVKLRKKRIEYFTHGNI